MTRQFTWLVLGVLVTACHRVGLVSSGQRMGSGGLERESEPYRSGPPWCFPDSGSDVKFLLAKFQWKMGTPAERARAGAFVPDSAQDLPGGVDVVRDEALCHSISMALDSGLFAHPRGQTVLVYSIPDEYDGTVGPGKYIVFALPIREGIHLNRHLRLYNSLFIH